MYMERVCRMRKVGIDRLVSRSKGHKQTNNAERMKLTLGSRWSLKLQTRMGKGTI
jgi:hypothetical protein